MGKRIWMLLAGLVLAAGLLVWYAFFRGSRPSPRLEGADLSCLSHVCQRFLTTQLDRGFRTLDFYQQWGN